MTSELTPTAQLDKFDMVQRWYKDERADDDPKRIRIPEWLQQQAAQWNLIYGLLSSGEYGRTTEQIAAVKRAFPGISDRTARHLLSDTKRFFSVLDAPNLAFERVVLIDELKDDIKKAKAKGDYRSVAALRALQTKVTGADQPEEVVENKTIFNIIAFNPEQLGVKLLDPGKLDSMIQAMLTEDKKKEERFFSQFEDVTHEEEPAA